MCFSIADQINIIRPEEVELFLDNEHNLGLRRRKDGITYYGLKATLLFPMTDRRSYIQLKDANDNEIGILRSFEGLDERSRGILESEIEKAYFIPAITKINSITDRFGVDIWDVETEKGPRSFEVAGKKRSIRYVTNDHIIIRDIDGNRYEIKSLNALDKASRKLIDRET